MKTTKAAVYPEQEYMVIDEDISADSGDTDSCAYVQSRNGE